MEIGTVGTGAIVSGFLAAAAHTDGAEASAVFSRRAESAAAMADRFGIPFRFTNRAAFLSSPAFDTVYVASPNSLHFEWCRDALLTGKNVICEKPFTSNLQEAEALAELAATRDLMLFEANMVPYLPNYLLLKETLPRIGTVKAAVLNYSKYSSRYNAFRGGKTANVFTTKYSGGALLDLGCYNVNFLTGLFGEAERVSYFPNRAENGVDTSGAAVLEYPGLRAVSIAAKDSTGTNTLEFQGTEGRIVCDGPANVFAGFTLYPGDGVPVRYSVQEGTTPADNMVYECRFFQRAVRLHDTAARDRALEHSLAVMRQLDAARNSAGIVFPADR